MQDGSRGYLAEGVLIVASILVAFAIDAWWAERQERQEELLLLEALRAEMEPAVDCEASGASECAPVVILPGTELLGILYHRRGWALEAANELTTLREETQQIVELIDAELGS